MGRSIGSNLGAFFILKPHIKSVRVYLIYNEYKLNLKHKIKIQNICIN